MILFDSAHPILVAMQISTNFIIPGGRRPTIISDPSAKARKTSLFEPYLRKSKTVVIAESLREIDGISELARNSSINSSVESHSHENDDDWSNIDPIAWVILVTVTIECFIEGIIRISIINNTTKL